MVMGLACTNVSAMNDTQDLEQGQVQTEREPGLFGLSARTILNLFGAVISLDGLEGSLRIGKNACETLDFCETLKSAHCQIASTELCAATAGVLLFGLLTYKFGSAAVEGLLKIVDKADQNLE
jgi:hypothetical protein